MSATDPRVAARDLLRTARVDAPPVRLGRLIRGLEIKVERTKLDAHVASVVLRGKELRIAVNKGLGRPRRRFATAHALGRHLLDDGAARAVVTDLTVELRPGAPPLTDPRTAEANTFALELLVPEYLLREELAAEPVDLTGGSGIERLAGRYRVSPGVIVVRAVELGYLWGR